MSTRLQLPRWVAGTLLLLAGQAVAELRVSEAWIREPPPVATPLAGYLRIANTGPEPRVLNAVRTPRAGDEIELTLEFGDGTCLPVRFVVVPSAGSRRIPAQR